MVKKALQLASVASMIDQFSIPNIQILQSHGYQVDVVANFTNPGTITRERADKLKRKLADMGVRVYDIAIPRSINMRGILSAYKKVKGLVKQENYSLIHCHSPIGGVVCRAAAKGVRKTGTKVIYTAHGFHFYKGAPIANWLIFYPIEKHFSKFTDVLITINHEDYKRACDKLRAKHTVYVPGVGVDTSKFLPNQDTRKSLRTKLGIDDSQIMLLSVGELNANKNHETVIRAIAGTDLIYVIVGKGNLSNKLLTIAKENKVDLRLMGYREDIADFYDAADVYILASKREGLNVSLMEAMAHGLSVTCSRIRGNMDLIDRPLFSPKDAVEMREAIAEAIEHREEYGKRNAEIIKNFDLSIVNDLIDKVYCMEKNESYESN